MHPLSFLLHFKFPLFPLAAAPTVCQLRAAIKTKQRKGVCLHIQCLFPFFPFSVSDSTQRRRLCDRSRLQPRLWLYCQSYMWREGGERGR